MFDPTIFDNLKVVIEGEVYDLDLEGKAQVIDRSDLIDLAKMSREYSITFREEFENTEATVFLNINADHLSSEILEKSSAEDLGCDLTLQFYLPISQVDKDCDSIKFIIARNWRKYHARVEQEVSFIYGDHIDYHDCITLTFPESINEEQTDLIPSLIQEVYQTIHSLNSYLKQPPSK